jgi:uncharacterized protein (DUF697 family)
MAVRGVMGKLRPVALTVNRVHRHAQGSGLVVVLPGDLAAADRLRQLLGVPATDGPLGIGMLVHAAVGSADPDAPARQLADHKRAGGRVLAILVGRPGERERMERRFLAHEPLEMSDLHHETSLEGAGGRGAVRAVVHALGEDAIAAGRGNPVLRKVVADRLIADASRRAGAIGVLVFVPGADMPILTVLQIGLVAQLAALHNHPLGAERAVEFGAVFGAGFGWRAVGRGLLGLLPGPSWPVKGGVAYGATRAMGEAARRWFEDGELSERPAAVIRGLMARRTGGGAS